jgi:hypothetical protein
MSPALPHHRPAYVQYTDALRAKGFVALASQVLCTRAGATIYTLWSNGTAQVLMERQDDRAGQPLWCDLWRRVADTEDTAATIAALP